jgi:2-polyprenyl-3-methyl-5-hydroxy-6-metoxy-1,4-benzoquinol methylase
MIGNKTLDRGGNSNLEKAHARELIKAGAEDIWGWSSPAGQERVRSRIQWFIKICNLRSGLNVLECGCGTGIFTRHLAETGANVTAVDISAELLKLAKNNCPSGVTFIQSDLEDPKELPNDHYDVLCGVSVLHHLKLPMALIELGRKLKPGACFAFSEPNLLNPINKYIIFTRDMGKRKKHGVSPTEMAFRPKELISLCRQAGFNVLTIEHRDFFISIGWGDRIYLFISNLCTWGIDLGFFQVIDQASDQMVFSKNAGQGGIPVYHLFLVPQAWTLSLELYFYLLAPFIVRRFKIIVAVYCISVMSYVIPYKMGLNFFHYLRFFPVTLSYFMVGAAVYWIYRKRNDLVKQIRYVALPLIFSVVLAAINFKSIPLDERLKLILFVALVSITIPFAFELTRNWRVDKFIGDLS